MKRNLLLLHNYLTCAILFCPFWIIFYALAVCVLIAVLILICLLRDLQYERK